MRYIALALMLTVLSGCVDPLSPPKPSPALQRLMFACDEGDMNACQAVASDEAARRQEALQLAQKMRIEPLDPEPFMRQTAQPVYYAGPWTTCMNGMRVPLGQFCPF